VFDHILKSLDVIIKEKQESMPKTAEIVKAGKTG
jgi:hypothetical protein